MALPSREVINEIRELIRGITGFKEDEENFAACEKYCLSHVIHHSYPSVNRNTVKKCMDDYASRFYVQGYFKVADALNSQVKSFLSHEELFQSHPEYDIQWTLLSLLSCLSSNLSSVSNIPELLPTDDEEVIPQEDIDWAKYLKQGLPIVSYDYTTDEDDEDDTSEDFKNSVVEDNNLNETGNSTCKYIAGTDDSDSNDSIIEQLHSSELNTISIPNYSASKVHLEEYVKNQIVRTSVYKDRMRRGNITTKYDSFMNSKGVCIESDILSELEVIEYILYQFQTGGNMFHIKGVTSPALCSITQVTLINYLSSLQQYFDIIKSFKEFNNEVTSCRYFNLAPCCQSDKREEDENKNLSDSSQNNTLILTENETSEKEENVSFQQTFIKKESCTRTSNKSVPNVIKAYCAALNKALEPFEAKIMNIEVHRTSYTLIQLKTELRPYFTELISLFRVHSLATSNWLEEPNWKNAVRIISVLYNAMMETTSTKMSFLYFGMFLDCFQVYLDIIDSWITCADLIDPHNEFLISKLMTEKKSEIPSMLLLHPYKDALQSLGIRKFEILDLIAEKMDYVGPSLEVLRHLDRFVDPYHTPWTNLTSIQTLYECLVVKIRSELKGLGILPYPLVDNKIQNKDKSIFTVKSIKEESLFDKGHGDEPNQRKANKKENCTKIQTPKGSESEEISSNVTSASTSNIFFKMAFQDILFKKNEFFSFEKEFTIPYVENGVARRCLSEQNLSEERESALSLHKIIKVHFSRLLSEKVSIACTLVKDIILDEFKLQKYLALLRSVMLCNDAYLLLPFNSLFFNQPSTWQNSYSLTLHLRECVEVAYKDLAPDLSVIILEENLNALNTVIEAIDGIYISLKVNWPLNLIIDEFAMSQYNDIFRLILKLKWAYSTLCNLRFQTTEKRDESLGGLLKSTYHRLQLLKHWCLSDLGRISNYFMTEVSTKLDVKLDECQNLKDIIKVHSQFINKIHRRCLLQENHAEGRELIFDSLIPLCKDLESYWLKGTVVPNLKLGLMESMFRSNHMRLSRLMTSLEEE